MKDIESLPHLPEQNIPVEIQTLSFEEAAIRRLQERLDAIEQLLVRIVQTQELIYVLLAAATGRPSNVH